MKDSKLDFNASANRRATREREREKSRWKHESRYTLLRSYSRCWFELGCNTHENVPSFRWGTTQRTRSRGKTRAVVNQYFQLSSMVPGRSLEKAQRVSFGSRPSHGWLLISPANPENRFFQFPLLAGGGEFSRSNFVILSFHPPVDIPDVYRIFKQISPRTGEENSAVVQNPPHTLGFGFGHIPSIPLRILSWYRSKISTNFSRFRDLLLKMIEMLRVLVGVIKVSEKV